VQLRCGGVPLFLARTGKRRDRSAVQIEDKLPTGDMSTSGVSTSAMSFGGLNNGAQGG
jgi:flagellar motor switch protein FliM